MKKVISLTLALLMALSVTLTACSGGTGDPTPTPTPAQGDPTPTPEPAHEPVRVDGGTLIAAEPADISSLNILYETGDEGMTMLRPVYDPLYVVAKDEIRYYLAESREVSEDGLTITVKLREGMTWHDGVPITADDVIWNFEMRSNPDNSVSSVTKVNGDPVVVEKIDELTFSVTMASVSASYDSTLGSIKLLPKHVYENEPLVKGCELNSTSGVGSGPYKVVEWKQGESLTLVRYEGYYRGVPSIENVVFKILPNESSQEMAFQNGDINMFRLNTSDKLEKYANNDNYQVYSIPEGRINYMAYNPNSAITADVRVREAISLALNADELILGAYGSTDLAVPAKTVFGDSNLYYADIDGYSQNIERAKELLAEAGVAEGTTLRLVYNSSRENMENCALIIQQQLKAVNLTVTLEGLETQGFFQKFFYTAEGDWELGLNGYSTIGDNNGDRMMFSGDGFLSKNLVCTDEITALWVQANETVDPAKRAELYSQIQQGLKDIYSFYPVSYPTYVVAVEKGYMGLDALPVVPLFEDYMYLYRVE